MQKKVQISPKSSKSLEKWRLAVRDHLIEEAKLASYGLNKKTIEKCNKEGILTEDGTILSKEELDVVVKYHLDKLKVPNY